LAAFDRLWRNGVVSVHSNVPRLDNILGEIGRFETNQQLNRTRQKPALLAWGFVRLWHISK
jgi:hypothetical protein